MTAANILGKLAFPRAMTWLVFSLLGLVLAVFFGLLACTDNPICMGVGVASLLAGYFLNT